MQQFASTRWLGTAARGFLGLALAFGLLVAILAAVLLALAAGDPAGATVWEVRGAPAAQSAILTVQGLHWLCGVVAGVLLLVWVYRVSANLFALGAPGRRRSPMWAVGGFLVPIVNLQHPYEAMCELWSGSVGGKPSPLIGWWWSLFLFGEIAGWISSGLMVWAPTVGLLRQWSWILLAGAVMGSVSLWCLIRVMQAVDRSQDLQALRAA